MLWSHYFVVGSAKEWCRSGIITYEEVQEGNFTGRSAGKKSITAHRRRWGGRSEFLLKQTQNGIIELLDAEAIGRGSEDGVIPSDGAEDTLGFAQ